MSRPNFSVTIPGKYTFSRPNGSDYSETNVTDMMRTTESNTGVSRRKPTVKWINPTSYTLTSRTYRRAVGRCENRLVANPNGSLGQIYTGVVGTGRFNSLQHFDETVYYVDLGNMEPQLKNVALIKARAKLRNASVNLGVAFAERKQTARLLGDTAFRLGKAFNNLKRGRVRAAMRDLGISNSSREPRGSNAPRKWLELQYGWKPLLSDVFGACDALSRRDKSHFRVTATATESVNRKFQKNWTGASMGHGEAQVLFSTFVRIDALPDNDLIMSLAQMGVTNPLLIGWELVPYSFVVDWALPVGSWLESLDALAGYSKASTSISTLIRGDWLDVGRSGKNGSDFYVKNTYIGTQRYVKLVREASNGVPQATFPRFKDPRSLLHMANGLSLLASAFGRR